MLPPKISVRKKWCLLCCSNSRYFFKQTSRLAGKHGAANITHPTQSLTKHWAPVSPYWLAWPSAVVFQVSSMAAQPSRNAQGCPIQWFRAPSMRAATSRTNLQIICHQLWSTLFQVVSSLSIISAKRPVKIKYRPYQCLSDLVLHHTNSVIAINHFNFNLLLLMNVQLFVI